MSLQQVFHSLDTLTLAFFVAIIFVAAFACMALSIYFMLSFKKLGRNSTDRFAERLEKQITMDRFSSNAVTIHKAAILVKIIAFAIAGTVICVIASELFVLPICQKEIVEWGLQAAVIFGFVYIFSVRVVSRENIVMFKALWVTSKTRDLTGLFDLQHLEHQRLRLIFTDQTPLTIPTWISGYGTLLDTLEGCLEHNKLTQLDRAPYPRQPGVMDKFPLRLVGLFFSLLTEVGHSGAWGGRVMVGMGIAVIEVYPLLRFARVKRAIILPKP